MRAIENAVQSPARQFVLERSPVERKRFALSGLVAELVDLFAVQIETPERRPIGRLVEDVQDATLLELAGLRSEIELLAIIVVVWPLVVLRVYGGDRIHASDEPAVSFDQRPKNGAPKELATDEILHDQKHQKPGQIALHLLSFSFKLKIFDQV